MTVDEASGYLRAAADSVNDARTELNRAIEKTDGEITEHLIEKLDDVAEDMEQMLRELATNSEVEELAHAESITMDEAKSRLETVEDNQ